MSKTDEKTLTIDGVRTTVPAGTTLLEAADRIGIRIPRLCHHPSLSMLGACRVCLVEVEGARNLAAACATAAENGMAVRTATPLLRRVRRDVVELILDNHPKDCQICERNGNCELQSLAYELGVRQRLFEGERKVHPRDESAPSVIRDPEKCILCGRCVRVCDEVQGVTNLGQQHRGFRITVGPSFDGPMQESVCVHCGQCANVCPTAAIIEHNHTDAVFEALADPDRLVLVQTAPAIRATIAEGFGFPPGTPATGKLAAALRLMGADRVFDTNVGADITVVEEAHEFLHRLESGGPLPLITSCSPGWINFMEHFYPELIPHASTCRSPMSMMSVLLKTYYAEKAGLDPSRLFVTAIMPCTAKKFEVRRPEHAGPDGRPYTDAVLTTRELIWMLKSLGVDFANLADGAFDDPLGTSSGAADIFGTTGGVMEAALRTAYESLTGQPCPSLDFEAVRGVEGVKEAVVDIAGKPIRVAVANGLRNARSLLDAILAGEKTFHLVEIMACPGGCIGGGGQPYPPHGTHLLSPDLLRLRARALYDIDRAKTLRTSHTNPAVQQLYREFLGAPNSPKAHELLHTHYEPKQPRGTRS
jgi:iron-only hydrogenase group A